MASNPDAPGLLGLLRGEGDRFMQTIAWTAVLLAAVGVVTALFAVAGIH